MSYASNEERADRLVARVTAFPSWAALQAAMESGYAPTLRGRNKAERELIALLINRGFRVWGNKGRFW